jgi:hypothetical protein
VSVTGSDPAEDQPPLPWQVAIFIDTTANGHFKVMLDQVSFRGHGEVQMMVELIWKPPAPSTAASTAQRETWTHDMQRKARKAIVEGVRERVELTSRVRPRGTDDLRAEERSVVYSALMRGLVGQRTGRELHTLSEVIKALFDVERMLYFVAPDWWSPRRRAASLKLPTIDIASGNGNQATSLPVTLSGADSTRFVQDGDGRRGGYLVTENSEPAPLGRSLGWIAQLDGDDRRNAFLNSPWVQAVLPIRPGREQAAIDFLKQPYVEDAHGLASEFVDEDGNPTGKTVEELLRALAGTIRNRQTPDGIYAAGQAVYENGFRPVDSNVQLGGSELDVFAQWVEMVPTRQVVPVVYTPPAPFQNYGSAAAAVGGGAGGGGGVGDGDGVDDVVPGTG